MIFISRRLSQVWVRSIVLALIAGVSAGGIYTVFYGISNKPVESISAAHIKDENEIHFVWDTLKANSLVTNDVLTLEQKSLRLDVLAKSANQRIQNMAARLNKYAGLFGAEWYASQSRQYAQLLTAEYPQNLFLLSSLGEYETNLQKEIESQLKNRNLLTSISFEEFDKYRVVIDNEYVEFSRTLFEAGEQSNQAWFSPIADTVIKEMATARGFTYKKTAKLEELVIAPDGYALRQGVRESFDILQQAARKDGVEFNLVSAFRDQESQLVLFRNEMLKYGVQLSRLNDERYINASTTREMLDKVLTRVAPPGFSRHHSGITVDLASPEGYDFGTTSAYRWLSENNYYNAKRFGFLPSYPQLDELTKYGPNPEAWEYFYAGLENTLDIK